jgi:hypothetical protein
MSTIVSALLNVTQVDEGQYFAQVKPVIAAGLSGLPEIPEFKEQTAEDLAEFLEQEGGTGQLDMANIQCTVERFDGQDPSTAADQLNVQVIPVNYNPDTGAFFKGTPLENITIETGEFDESTGQLTYTISGLDTYVMDGDEKRYGVDYVLRFDIDSYDSDLPEIFFWLDGWVEDNELCGIDYPLFIGPD